uniref:Uncharacterized protein n=1 Tax=Lactuca sativa TaxID=4236 RepID=A0A9R1UJ26_LACSA|nr:hypothetical protein LSAT_V11C900456100 [Lactuca sativa]
MANSCIEIGFASIFYKLVYKAKQKLLEKEIDKMRSKDQKRTREQSEIKKSYHVNSRILAVIRMGTNNKDVHFCFLLLPFSRNLSPTTKKFMSRFETHQKLKFHVEVLEF